MKTLKAKSLRWDYGLGAMEEESLVEICFDDSGRDLYIMDVKMEEFERVFISDKPMMDLFLEDNFDLIEDGAMEDYDIETVRPDPGMKDSEYALGINLVRVAMKGYDCTGNNGLNDALAELFLNSYKGKDLASLEIPMLFQDISIEEYYQRYLTKKTSCWVDSKDTVKYQDSIPAYTLETNLNGYHEVHACGTEDAAKNEAISLKKYREQVSGDCSGGFEICKVNVYWDVDRGPVFEKLEVVEKF